MSSSLGTHKFSDSYWVDGDIRIKSADLMGTIGDEVEMSVDYLWDFCIYKDGINLTEFNRAMNVDSKQYPLIISMDEDVEMIIDGHHRLYKARFFCQSKIKVRILDLKSAPEKFKIFKRVR